jgi:uncharacterized Ntn-hydrolase superfamily protein
MNGRMLCHGHVAIRLASRFIDIGKIVCWATAAFASGALASTSMTWVSLRKFVCETAYPGMMANVIPPASNWGFDIQVAQAWRWN